MRYTLTKLLLPLPLISLVGCCSGIGCELTYNELLLFSIPIAIILIWTTVSILLNAIKIKKIQENGFSPNVNAKKLLAELDEEMVKKLLLYRKTKLNPPKKNVVKIAISLFLLNAPFELFAQTGEENQSLFTQSGIIITLVLIILPLLFLIFLLIIKIKILFKKIAFKKNNEFAIELANYIKNAEDEEIDSILLRRNSTFNYTPPSLLKPSFDEQIDQRGIIHSTNENAHVSLVAQKTKQRINIENLPHNKLILWFIGSSIFWLLFGTTVGEYLGIKFVSPEVDSLSWLSFGRLRPVHTNAVFWGWSSLAMLGLAYYVVPKVSNTNIVSINKGWWTLWLINSSVIIGSLCLMNGLNNGGGEYREYVWPVMILFGLGLLITLINFLNTIAKRKSPEIYISNWYIISAIIFTLIIVFIAYWPSWQTGLGETIVQGYYMHQGVGMWFMLFNLGLVYYFLPQQVNKPIYSYGLGILAFWSQIIFYTLIGTHHFVFSSIPWWLQTVAIVGSVGMVIPVIAGSTNFLMTFKGSWSKLSTSYTLPFFFVGLLFYFTGSFQGTAEAFRYTNLLWHFTDFTVAHSHLTMYGIIAFLLWGSIYLVVPNITGKEPSHLLTGIHFWMAFIGLLFYTIPLMIGGTLKGMAWMEGQFFMDTVKLMKAFWLWRAIGGTFMWISHIVFAFNFYQMISSSNSSNTRVLTIKKIKKDIHNIEY